VVVEDPGIYAELVAMLEREVSSQLTQHLQEEGGAATGQCQYPF